jgi:hypothetical protein
VEHRIGFAYGSPALCVDAAVCSDVSSALSKE